jgi:N-acetylglucosaminyldiphosphoundecaprenol N-acetyl-beta-D-mannosaminyltransferase
MQTTPQSPPSTASTAANGVITRDVLGVPISMVDYDQTIEVMDRLVGTRERGYVCVAPVHALMEARKDSEVLAALRAATLVVPDGMPVVWAATASTAPS